MSLAPPRLPLRKRLAKGAEWTLTFLLMVVICVPGLWVILSAFRPNAEILAKPPVWIPQDLTLNNFAKIFGWGSEQVAIPVGSYFVNSMVIALTSTIVALVIGMAGGYAFARYRFPFKGGWFLGLMLFRTVPGIALSLPIFMMWSRLGLIDTKMGLIIIYVSLNVPFTIWLIDGFFRQIPTSCPRLRSGRLHPLAGLLEDRVSAGALRIAAAGVFAFLTSWNEFALASQLTRSTDSKTSRWV